MSRWRPHASNALGVPVVRESQSQQTIGRSAASVGTNGGNVSCAGSCDLAQAPRPFLVDITQSWPLWLYFNSFPDGIELLNKGVRTGLVSVISSSSDADQDYALVVTVAGDQTWTVIPRERKSHPGDMSKPR